LPPGSLTKLMLANHYGSVIRMVPKAAVMGQRQHKEGGTKRRRGVKVGFSRLDSDSVAKRGVKRHHQPTPRLRFVPPKKNRPPMRGPLPHRRPVAPLTHPHPRRCPYAFSRGGFRVSTFDTFFFWQNLFFGNNISTYRGRRIGPVLRTFSVELLTKSGSCCSIRLPTP